MTNNFHKQKGTAIMIALVAAAVLMQLAAVYMTQIRNSAPQTSHVDERVRLRYLAHGLTELALLKYQKYPADFYNAWKYARSKNDFSIVDAFAHKASEFSDLKEIDQPRSSLNENDISIKLATMTLTTSNQWGVEVLLIRAEAEYKSRTGKALFADAVRTVRSERIIQNSIPDPEPDT